MRRKPSFSYCGLTVVMSNPSRFDKQSLLSANGGYFFNEQCLRPSHNIHQCDLRLKEHTDPLLPGTKCVLLLGAEAAKLWLPHLDNSLNEIRGSVYFVNEVPHIASYYPQDCVDIIDYEGQFNPAATTIAIEDGDEEDEYGSEKSRHGRTKRRNFGFWLQKDVEKCKYVLKHGVPKDPEPNYVIYPAAEKVIELLTNTKNGNLYIDIETDKNLNILCFSFSFNLPNIFVVPCLLQDYSWAYDALPKIYRALAVAFRDNCTIAHNGSGFDFFVFAHKYRLAIRRVYDTMLAQHRCFPEAEKSLGHCTSLWTWQPFHKDLGDVSYCSNPRQIWEYCGKDVYTMILIREAIDAYAKKHPGVAESIALANASIRPYLTCILQGIQYRQDLLLKTMNENDRLCMQYLRMLEILIGRDTLKRIRGKGKSSMPGSNLQCCRYFHEELGYPIIARGKEKQDGTRAPSLGKKAMFKLKLKYENPVIDIIIAYREAMKESGSLKFNPWVKPADETGNTNTAVCNGPCDDDTVVL